MTRPHGYARYRLDGCRCYTCAWARAEYDNRRNTMIAAGQWRPFTPLAPVRRHVLDLKAVGLGDRQVAQLAECGRKWVRDVAHGYRHDPGRGNPPLSFVRTEHAAAVLAVPVDILLAASGAYVPAGQVWAWVDALLAAGWSKARISAGIGNNGRALQLSHHQVTGSNARAVHALFLEQFGEPRPATDMDWAVVERVIAGDRMRMTSAERREVVTRLHALGLSDQEAATRSGLSARTVLRIRHELNLETAHRSAAA